ncbi:DUF1697 domain-containing protein [Intrasporangium sp.]|uniref:DUF1697 domain-containing protein n=1 Tax=Intrasporangium sp. TaxID=1925024 RepID=UPI002939F7AD|nr:DUF1697 domain-containing protein [Intrasporangium sp.]MDV3221123.1 DUF1697 domain-containing protein [Intrasporangium sp.]
MSTWFVFLRAINIGARRFPMAELRAVLAEAGYGGVETHIQTGNVRLTASHRSRTRLEAALEELLEKDRGFPVATIALTPRELTQVAADATAIVEAGPAAYGQYVSLLKATPSAADVERVEALSREGERILVRGRAVHFCYDVPYHAAKVSNAAIEKILGPATNRNVTVITALAEKWC